jgi:hypothetical protein
MGFAGLPFDGWLGRRPPEQVIFRMEDPDGLILGVLRAGDECYYARFDQYRGKWSKRISNKDRELVEEAWAAEENRALAARLEQLPGS